MDYTQIHVFTREDAGTGVWAPVLAQGSQGCPADAGALLASVEHKNDGSGQNFWALTVFLGDGKGKAAR